MANRFFCEDFRSPCSVVIVLLLLMFCGCRPDEQIVRHRIPKSQSGLETLRAPSKTEADESGSPAEFASHRMVVGVYELERATWFFKILGPIQQVTQSEGEWKSFLQAVTFENGQPQWELPPGWKTGGRQADAFRDAGD